MMISLFDPDEIMRLHLKTVKKEGAIQNAVEMCQEFGLNYEETIEKIAEKFELAPKDAAGYVEDFWTE